MDMNIKNLNINVELDIKDLLGAIDEHLDYDQIFDFIVNLDEEICNWEFTNRLYEHFKKMHKEFLEETKGEEKNK